MKNLYIALLTFAVVLMFMLNHERANANGFDHGLCHNPNTGAVVKQNSWGQCPRGFDEI
jgi:hypothetical protein